MASGQKKRGNSSGRSNSKGNAGRASNKNGGKQNTRTQQERYSDGIMLAVVIAVMLFVMCCNIGLCGIVGSAIRTVLFGLFGFVEFLLPFAVILAFVMAVVYNYSGMILRKITLSGVFMVFLCAFSQMCVHISWGFKKIPDSFTYSSEHHTAGGVVGAIVTGVFYPLLAKSGTWILVILVLLILAMLIAGTTVIDMAKQVASWYHLDEDELAARDEMLQRKREHAMARQQDRRETRKQRYQETAAREEDSLAELQRRREARRQKMENADLDTRLERNMMILKEGEADQGLKPAKNTSGGVLSDAGFSNVESSGAEIPKKRKSRKTTNAEPSFDINGPSESNADSLSIGGSKEPSNVTVSSNGELHITGLVNEEEMGPKEPVNREPVNLSGVDTMPVGSFEAPRSRTKVTETTAQFVSEEEAFAGAGASAMAAAEVDAVMNPEDAKTRHRKHTKESARETAVETANTSKEVAANAAKSDLSNYKKPILTLLGKGSKAKGNTKAELQATAKKLEETLDSFGVHVTVTDVSCGPAVTRYEMQPEVGTRVNKITGLADDIKLNLAVADIRIEAPIPGKSAVGIEVPNKEAAAVAFRDLIEESDFMDRESDLSFAVGKDISGDVVITDIAKMPHVLIAGSTGSGKSVCINTLIMSLLYKAHPDDVKLIMIDPKVVELSVYNGIPHLLIPVVTDPKKASGALNWAVAEMDARYKKFSEYQVRNLEGYNKKVDQLNAKGENPDGEITRMPKIVIIVDELADLMMVAHGEVEDAIVRLSQLARAAGIHLVIATQRPSVDVITGLIKANVPSRIAFAVSSMTDSRTILDMGGAEKLLGKGDMLFYPSGFPKPVRVQGAFISDKEVGNVVEYLKAQGIEANYNDNITKEIDCGPQNIRDANREQDRDEYFIDAAKFIVEKQKASIGMLQRVYKIGFNRAARIMDQLSEAGVVGPEEGTKPRQVLYTMEQLENAIEQGEI